MILLLTPPLTQLNTPYPATAALTGWLERLGVESVQRDLSIEVALDVLSRYGEQPLTDRVIAFLQGKCPDDAEELADPDFLPEGDSFRELDHIGWVADPLERAKLRCSLYLDDLAKAIQEQVDPDFGFSRYAEHLGEALPDFGVLLRRLRRHTPVDRILEQKVAELLDEVAPRGPSQQGDRPLVVGITCPFPGTLLGAFRIASVVRKLRPGARVWLGGGYVSTELRFADDPRITRYFDELMFDEGYDNFRKLLAPLGYGPGKTRSRSAREAWRMPIPPFVKPSYRGLDLTQYIDLAETANPMHRLWSDGRWLKMQLARGCYWHKCAFCDVTLDYIKCFAMPEAVTLVDAMQALVAETQMPHTPGSGCLPPSFHFTDEAIPPVLAEKLAREILRRKFVCRWWGNIRFDASWTPARCRLLAKAGCIAVTGGLECAVDRLLTLMNKGITRASAQVALANFAQAGILVHAYLMYGFPTQTERELRSALAYVRDRFREGTLQSAFFHRFALTIHSPIAKDPARFGIRIVPRPKVRFALNEIPYEEPGAPDWGRFGRPLKLALYNYMLGLGLSKPISFWFDSAAEEGE